MTKGYIFCVRTHPEPILSEHEHSMTQEESLGKCMPRNTRIFAARNFSADDFLWHAGKPLPAFLYFGAWATTAVVGGSASVSIAPSTRHRSSRRWRFFSGKRHERNPCRSDLWNHCSTLLSTMRGYKMGITLCLKTSPFLYSDLWQERS